MRQEFIEQLRIALQGKIPQEKLNEHLHYYDNYIMEEARKGRTEEQVIDSLGDPRLIAKTLAMTDISGKEEGTGVRPPKGVLLPIVLAVALIMVVLSFFLRK